MAGADPTETCTYQRVKAFIDGWDASRTCLLETLAYVPKEQLVEVVRRMRERDRAYADSRRSM